MALTLKLKSAVEVKGCFKCKRARCDLCHNYLVESNSFRSFQTGKSYKIRSKLSCDSKNVIYLASRKKCNLQYMVTKKKNTNRTPHDLNNFSFQCIDQVQITANNSSNIEKLLITKEAYWSAQLFSLAPFGLNKCQEFHSKKRINFN